MYSNSLQKNLAFRGRDWDLWQFFALHMKYKTGDHSQPALIYRTIELVFQLHWFLMDKECQRKKPKHKPTKQHIPVPYPQFRALWVFFTRYWDKRPIHLASASKLCEGTRERSEFSRERSLMFRGIKCCLKGTPLRTSQALLIFLCLPLISLSTGVQVTPVPLDFGDLVALKRLWMKDCFVSTPWHSPIKTPL